MQRGHQLAAGHGRDHQVAPGFDFTGLAVDVLPFGGIADRARRLLQPVHGQAPRAHQIGLDDAARPLRQGQPAIEQAPGFGGVVGLGAGLGGGALGLAPLAVLQRGGLGARLAGVAAPV